MMFYWDGDWHISPTFGASFSDVVNDLHNVIFFVNTLDRFAWQFSSNGVFATKWAFDFFRSSSPKVAWGRDLWRHYLPPSRSFLCWRAFLYCLPIDDILYDGKTSLEITDFNDVVFKRIR